MISVFIENEKTGGGSLVRVDPSWSLFTLKNRLELITGIPSAVQCISFCNSRGQCMNSRIPSDSDVIEPFVSADCVIKVACSGNAKINDFSDVSRVKKFELTDEEYEKRSETVRKWKQINNIGTTPVQVEDEDCKAVVGDRCMVQTENLSKKGTVRFVGSTSFKPGLWVGVEYDEPLGKHNGTVDGVCYFSCPSKCGAFVKPSSVTILTGADAEEEDPFAEL